MRPHTAPVGTDHCEHGLRPTTAPAESLKGEKGSAPTLCINTDGIVLSATASAKSALEAEAARVIGAHAKAMRCVRQRHKHGATMALGEAGTHNLHPHLRLHQVRRSAGHSLVSSCRLRTAPVVLPIRLACGRWDARGAGAGFRAGVRHSRWDALAVRQYTTTGVDPMAQLCCCVYAINAAVSRLGLRIDNFIHLLAKPISSHGTNDEPLTADELANALMAEPIQLTHSLNTTDQPQLPPTAAAATLMAAAAVLREAELRADVVALVHAFDKAGSGRIKLDELSAFVSR